MPPSLQKATPWHRPRFEKRGDEASLSYNCEKFGVNIHVDQCQYRRKPLLLRQLYYGVHEAVIRGRLCRHEVIAVQVLVGSVKGSSRSAGRGRREKQEVRRERQRTWQATQRA